MCKKAVEEYLWCLLDVPDHFQTLEMCRNAVEECPLMCYIPDHFKTQEMCKKAVEEILWFLQFVPVKLITQEMCKKVVEEDPWV